MRTTRLRFVASLALLIVVASVASGCDGSVVAGGDNQLTPLAERLAATSLALRLPEAASGATPAATGRPTGSSARIGNSGGTGVALRSDCLDTARSGGGWADEVVVTIVEVGTDRCAGWTRVSQAATTSWVRTEYLVSAGAAPVPTAGPAAPSGASGDLRRQVAVLRDTSWNVALLLRATPGRGNGVMAPTYLGMAASNAKDLATQVRATPADARANCTTARTRLANAAGLLETAANAAKGYFEAPAAAGVTSTTRATEAYINAQSELVTAINACLAG